MFSKLNEIWPGKSKWLIFIFLICLFFLLKSLMQPKTYSIGGEADGILTHNAALPDEDKLKLAEKNYLSWAKTGKTSSIESQKIVIVEYVDFTCVHCRASWPAVLYIKEKYPNVELIIKDRTPTERSLNLALASHCAGEQGYYWQAYDKFFKSQSDTFGTTTTEITKALSYLRLDWDLFNACLSSQKYLPQIKENMQDQEKLSVEGTPTWFVNGSQFTGEMTNDEADKIINSVK